jgi:hypothetical protein
MAFLPIALMGWRRRRTVSTTPIREARWPSSIRRRADTCTCTGDECWFRVVNNYAGGAAIRAT